MPDWPHAPVHRLGEHGAYMVTAGTYVKRHVFDTPDRLAPVQDTLLAVAREFHWDLQAWAVLSNHYHFVAISPEDASSLARMLSKLHTQTAAQVNAADATPGRQVWSQFWDTQLTHICSYLARLHYVHDHPVKHGLITDATKYPWCSAAWFEATASESLRRTVRSFKTDQLKIIDDF